MQNAIINDILRILFHWDIEAIKGTEYETSVIWLTFKKSQAFKYAEQTLYTYMCIRGCWEGWVLKEHVWMIASFRKFNQHPRQEMTGLEFKQWRYQQESSVYILNIKLIKGDNKIVFEIWPEQPGGQCYTFLNLRRLDKRARS